MSNSKPNVTAAAMNSIAQFLLEASADGKLPCGRISEAAGKWGYLRRTIHTIWSKAKEQKAAGMPISLRNKKTVRVREKIKVFDQEILKQIPLHKRRTYRTIAHEMNVSKNTVGKWFKSRLIRAHTNQIKPILKDKNKLSRLHFCLDALQVDTHDNVVKFQNMQQIIHIEEKWFNLSRANKRYYVADGESDPYRSCQNKRFITKVMFLCAVARPLYNESGECIFDGKIGIFPFTEQVPAIRNSINRPADTLYTKAMNSVTKDVTRECLINKVIPAIKARWPPSASKNILIQQDNARPHIGDGDPDFREAANSDGFNIHLIFQPSNSPDTNINDLGWFRALQSLQEKTVAYTIDELLQAVQTSFNELTHEKLNFVFLSLQACLVEIMKVKGHNNYKQPHLGKEALLRADLLPYVLEVDQRVVKQCIAHLVEANQAGGLEAFMAAVSQLPELDEEDYQVNGGIFDLTVDNEEGINDSEADGIHCYEANESQDNVDVDANESDGNAHTDANESEADIDIDADASEGI